LKVWEEKNKFKKVNFSLAELKSSSHLCSPQERKREFLKRRVKGFLEKPGIRIRNIVFEENREGKNGSSETKKNKK
jgi:hypothetical protein